MGQCGSLPAYPNQDNMRKTQDDLIALESHRNRHSETLALCRILRNVELRVVRSAIDDLSEGTGGIWAAVCRCGAWRHAEDYRDVLAALYGVLK